MNNIDYTALAKEIITSHMLFANDYKKAQLASDFVNSSSFKCDFYYDSRKGLRMVYIYNEVYAVLGKSNDIIQRRSRHLACQLHRRT